MRPLLSSLVFLLASGAGVCAEPSSAAGSPIIQLPAYPVKGELVPRIRESWRHAQIGDFEVLSNATEKETSDAATSLWKFQALFHEAFPLAKNIGQEPMTLVLCDTHTKFHELVPKATDGFSIRASTCAGDADGITIVVDLEPNENLAAPMNAAEQMLSTETGPADLPDPGADGKLTPSQLLNREYIHFVLSRFNPRPPAWFAEGIAQLYCRLELDGNSYKFGNLDGALMYFFSQRQLMPMEKFFAVNYESPDFLQPVNGMFAEQAFAFMHLCLYRNQGALQKPLFELVRRASREPVTEKLFKEVFGMSYGGIMLKIRGHTDGVSYQSKNAALPHPLDVPILDLREATDAEIGRIKGDTLRLIGRYDAARTELLSPYQRANTDPRLLASIAFLDRAQGNTPVATKYLAMATTAKVSIPGPYVYLAESRLQELAAPGNPPLTPAQASELLQLLGKAAAMNPPRADVYRVLSEVWLHTATPPRPENLAVLDSVVKAFPRDSALIDAATRAKLRAGAKADAAVFADFGLKSAPDDATKKKFAELKAQATR